MKLPRDMDSIELINKLKKYGYQTTRQTGSHIRLTSKIKGTEHHITILKHKEIRIGTLGNIVYEVASYLEIDRRTLISEIFG
jgi:predicted RNA binding protein YcfA (HicA-like mRNA interferase family)